MQEQTPGLPEVWAQAAGLCPVIPRVGLFICRVMEASAPSADGGQGDSRALTGAELPPRQGSSGSPGMACPLQTKASGPLRGQLWASSSGWNSPSHAQGRVSSLPCKWRVSHPSVPSLSPHDRGVHHHTFCYQQFLIAAEPSTIQTYTTYDSYLVVRHSNRNTILASTRGLRTFFH